MAGFRKDKSTGANAAVMTAGDIVSALVNAGVVKTAKAAAAAAVEVAEALFEFTGPIVDADNEVFEAADAAAPKSKSTGRGKSTSTRKSSGGKSTGTTGRGADTKLGFGVFKGLTLAEIAELSDDDAESDYGYTQGSGLDYLEWLSENANEAKVAKAAQSVIDEAA